MKKNSNNIFTSAIAMAAVTLTAIFTACSNNDDPVIDDTTMVSTYTITVDADLVSDNATTRALDIDGTGVIKSTWAATDKVAVYYKNKNTFVGTLSPTTTGTASTTLTGTLSFPAAHPANSSYDLFLYFPSRDVSYDNQSGTLATIAQNNDCAEATVDITAVDNTNKVITTGSASFTKQQAIVKFILKDKSGNSISASRLSISDNKRKLVVTSNGSTTTNGCITITSLTPTSNYYVALQGIEDCDIFLSAIVGTDVYHYYKNNITFENGKSYTVTVKMEKMQSIQLWENGPYWADYNLPGHYQWGATTPSSSCNSESCPYYEKIDNKWTWTKYTDKGATLELIDDAARSNWGTPWRMPTSADFQALKDNTTFTYYQGENKYKGRNGILLTGKGSFSDKSIFLPYTGYWSGATTIFGVDSNGEPTGGYYWSSSQDANVTNLAIEFGFSSTTPTLTNHPSRTRGCAIRPLHD